jgi:aryl-alcohol dehydrogenase-like predicted oxidoreductase
VGASNYAAWQLMKALGIAHRAHFFPGRQPADLLLAAGPRGRVRAIPLAIDQGLGVLVWSPLAGGLLSGAPAGRAGPAGSRHLTDW